MEPQPGTSSATSIDDSHARKKRTAISPAREVKQPPPGGTFKCAYCPLEEHYDYRGSKPPFARKIIFSEDCYIMKDPMSPLNKGEVLVIGGECSFCKKVVCLGCSIFYVKRFCPKCANDCIAHLPPQLHPKIASLTNEQKK